MKLLVFLAGAIMILGLVNTSPLQAGTAAATQSKQVDALPGTEPEKPLSNPDVVAMFKAGLGESIVITEIQQAHEEKLDASADALIALKKSGVTQPIIEAILKRVGQRGKATAQSAPAQQPKAEPRKEEKHDGAGSAAADVKLYFGEKPTDPFHELGRVSAGKYNMVGISRERKAIDDELKKSASKMGGNAVISITEDFASVSGVVIVFDKKD